MNIATPDLAQAWRDGNADALASRTDVNRYAGDTDDSRCYRDGHRMGRRQVMDGPPPTATAPEPSHPLPVGGLDGQPAIAAACTPAAADPMQQFAGDLERQITGAHAGHPSAFSDPIPGKRAKKEKPADPDQASLF